MFMDMICHIESWITAHIKDAFIYQGLSNHREFSHSVFFFLVTLAAPNSWNDNISGNKDHSNEYINLFQSVNLLNLQ